MKKIFLGFLIVFMWMWTSSASGMICLDNTDTLEGGASVAAVVDYTAFGLVGSTFTNIAQGQLSDTDPSVLYTAGAGISVVSVVFVNTHSAAVTVNLYLDPANAGTPRRLIPKNLSLGAGYSMVFDGQRCSVLNDSGGLISAFAGVLSIPDGGTGQTTASSAFDALSPMTTAGDLIYGGASGTGTRLPAGETTEILVGGGAAPPVWTPATGTGPPARATNPVFDSPTLGDATGTTLDLSGNLDAGTATVGSGSITDSSGAISFGDENLSTTGTFSSGAATTASLNNSDGNITNVGDIAVDSISADAGSGGSIVVNEAGADVDFRVEGSGEANAFFVQGSDGYVGIGTNSPNASMDIAGTSHATTSQMVIGDYDGATTFLGIGVLNNSYSWIQSFGGEPLYVNGQGNDTILNPSSGNVGINTTTPATKFAVNGLTSTSSYNLVRVDTADGDFYYDSSSERNKDDISEMTPDWVRLLAITPVLYTDKTSKITEPGLLAEDLDKAGLQDLVIYDKYGQPNGIKYERVSLYLLSAVRNMVWPSLTKEQKDKISAITKDIWERQYIRDHTKDMEVPKEEAFEDETRLVDTEEVIEEKTEYSLDGDKVTPKNVKVYRKSIQPTGKKKLRDGIKFDPRTGKFFRKVAPDKIEEEFKKPSWLLTLN